MLLIKRNICHLNYEFHEFNNFAKLKYLYNKSNIFIVIFFIIFDTKYQCRKDAIPNQIYYYDNKQKA